MSFNENNEVVKLLIKIGEKLNRSPEELRPFIKTIVEDNWLESIESLKRLKDADWDKLNLPIRFLKEIRQELFLRENEKNNIQVSPYHDQQMHSQIYRNILRNEDVSKDGNNSSSNSNGTRNFTFTRNKTKIEQIKGNHKDKDGNEQFTKKIKKSTNEDLIKENQGFSLTNNMAIANNNMFAFGQSGNLEQNMNIYNNKQIQNKHPEFPFIKFNVEVYNELLLCGIQDMEVENVFYFTNEGVDNDNLLHNEGDSSISTKDKYDKHSIDLYNAAEKLKNIDAYNLKGVIEVFAKIIRNILISPKIIKTRILKCNNAIIRERILKYKECINFLESLGFVLIQAFYVLQKVNCIILTCAYETLENLARNYNTVLPSLPKKYFNPYKASIICTDSFKAKNILTNDNTDQILKQKKEELNKLMSQAVDLNPRIYLYQRKSVNQDLAKDADMSDVDEPNNNEDVSYIMSQIKNLYKEQTFQSKTKMELQKISKAQVYVKTVLKILFPNQYVLELNFSPCTSMKHVHECIQQFLNSSIASKEWFIYEPPTIKKFDLHKKLTDYNLVPCAFLRFKLNDIIDNNILNAGFFSHEAMAKYFVILQ